MNKKTFITMMLALVTVAGQAQKQVVWEKPAAFMGAYKCSRWDRYLGMTAVMTQVPVPRLSDNK